MVKKVHMPTNAKVRKSIRLLSGVEKENTQGSSKALDQIDPTLKSAVIEKIDLSELNGDGWHVTYPDGSSNTVSMSNSYGIEWLPSGTIKNGYLYPDKAVTVNILEKGGNGGNQIVSAEREISSDLEPNSTKITRGSSSIVIKDGQVEIVTDKLIINGVEYNG